MIGNDSDQCVPTDSVSIYKWMLLCSWNWNSTKIKLCQNVTFYHWVSSFWYLKGLSSLQNVRNSHPTVHCHTPEDVTFEQHCCGSLKSHEAILMSHTFTAKFFIFLSHTLYAVVINKDNKNLKRNGVCNARQCWVDTSISSPCKQGGNSHSIACLLRGKWWNTKIFLRECWYFILVFGLGEQLSFKAGHSAIWCVIVKWHSIQSWLECEGGWSASHLPGMPTKKGCKYITGVISNMVSVNSGFSENCTHFEHPWSRRFTSPLLGQKKFK